MLLAGTIFGKICPAFVPSAASLLLLQWKAVSDNSEYVSGWRSAFRTGRRFVYDRVLSSQIGRAGPGFGAK